MCFLKYKEIPKLNLDYPNAREHIIKSVKYWLAFGFDGVRLDHVVGPKHKFWKIFRNEIKKEFPDAVLIGEACMFGIKLSELKTINIKNKFIKWLIHQESDLLLKEYYGELDGVLDFKFQELMKECFRLKNPDIKKLKLKLKKHYKKFSPDYFLPCFLDNHDINRFLFECSNDIEKLKQAVKIQFEQDQPIIIYQGTEFGMTQEKAISDFSSHGDLQVRKPLPWNKPNKKIFEFYKELIKQRND